VTPNCITCFIQSAFALADIELSSFFANLFRPEIQRKNNNSKNNKTARNIFIVSRLLKLIFNFAAFLLTFTRMNFDAKEKY